MKRIIFTLLLSLVLWPSMAQKYDALWKKAESAWNDELPRTTLDIVRQIYDKALAEGNDAELLRAAYAWCSLSEDLSPDSGRVALLRMDSVAARESRPAVRALWASVLGRLCAASGYDTATVARSRAYYRQSVEPVEALAAAKATDFLPLFVVKKGSAYFRDDLLSVVARTCVSESDLPLDERRALLHRLMQHYTAAGMPEAVLLLRLDSIALRAGAYRDNRSPATYEALAATAREFEALPLNVETYIRLIECASVPGVSDSVLIGWAQRGLALYGKEKRSNVLRNYLSEQARVKLHLIADTDQSLSGRPVAFRLNGRNLRSVELRLYRIADYDGSHLELPEAYTQKPAAHAAGAPVRLSCRFGEAPLWREQRDTLTFTPDAPGLYVVEAVADGGVRETEILRVSDVRAVLLPADRGRQRVAVVDARTGAYLPEGRLITYDEEGNRLRTCLPEADGFLTVPIGGAVDRIVPVCGTDVYASAMHTRTSRFYGYSSDTHTVRTETRIDIFTDRAIYRPAQTVHFGGVVFTQTGDSLHVASSYKAKVRLVNANGKEVQTMQVFVDEMGHFSGEFTLPRSCLPGYFSLRVTGQDQTNGHTSFRVEEYKRPTFTAEVAEPVGDYAPGDSVCLHGRATAYTGMPVAGGRVQWTVNRRMWYATGEPGVPVTGEGVTDAEGRFEIPLRLNASAEELSARAYNRFFYTVSYTVTAENGETASGSIGLQVATSPLVLESDWPKEVCREDLPALRFIARNGAGRELPGTVRYRLWQLHKSAAGSVSDSTCVFSDSLSLGATARPDCLRSLPSGWYRWQAETDGKKGTASCFRTFLLFSETDTKPVSSAALQHYVRQSAAADSAFVTIGSPSPGTTLLYAFYADGSLREMRRIALADTLLHFSLPYRPDYGDGALACFALMSEGKLHTLNVEIKKPAPEKQLCLRWSTFRSPLTPGSTEEWRLRVLHRDGSPADAALLVRLYDQSLDALFRKPWNWSGFSFYRSGVWAQWETAWQRTLEMWGSGKIGKPKAVPALDFTQWHLPDMSAAYLRQNDWWDGGTNLRYGAVRPMRTAARKSAVMEDYDAGLAEVEAVEALDVDSAAGASDFEEEPLAVQPRTNFAETALFAANLRTNAEGEAVIAFTLPQSLTSWRFEALAHTVAMDYGRLDTVAVARRELMVQPALPRFLRAGDRATLPATVSNLSATQQSVRVQLEIRRAADDALVCRTRENIDVPAGATGVVNFRYDVPADAAADLLVVRVVAESERFADGEEHFLPVLTGRAEVTHSLPFTLTQAGSRTLRLDTLWSVAGGEHPVLTLETTANPTWFAVNALPVLAQPVCWSATDRAVRFYALSVSQYVARSCPEIRAAVQQLAPGENLPDYGIEGLDDSTPWLPVAAREALRSQTLCDMLDEQTADAMLYTARDGLQSLQNGDGSWSWFRGMRGNVYTSAEIAMLLARTEQQTGEESGSDMLEKTMKYLDGEMQRRVEEMKKQGGARNDGFIDDLSLRYLYLYAITQRQPSAASRYLLDRAEQAGAGLSIYGKALLAVVMQRAGHKDKADRLLQSLLEFTVSSPDMGRWFDTRRAGFDLSSQRLLAQTATLEAMSGAGETYSTEMAEMRLWLMQTRRTGMWSSSAVAADAVYAVLMADAGENGRVKALSDARPVYMTLQAGKRIVDAPAAASAQGLTGYTLREYDEATHPALFAGGRRAPQVNLTVRQDGAGLAWGSATVRLTVPTDSLLAAASGLTLSRRFEVWRATGWTVVTNGDLLHRGDRVRQVFTFTADRDYDFVCLNSDRPACLEPARPLSGYLYENGLSVYRAVADTENRFYFERVSKGRHVYTEEYFVDRSGTYRAGLAHIRSVYAPEFCAHTGSAVLQVE